MRYFFITLCLLFSAPAQAADARLMLNIMKCESGMRYDASGDDGVSRGIAQFRKETFYEFAAMAKKDGSWKPALGKPSWMNPAQQIFLLEWGLDHDLGNRWTCYQKIMLTKQYAVGGSKYHEGVKWRARQIAMHRHHAERWRLRHHAPFNTTTRKLL
jgi:hypothetical protein